MAHPCQGGRKKEKKAESEKDRGSGLKVQGSRFRVQVIEVKSQAERRGAGAQGKDDPHIFPFGNKALEAEAWGSVFKSRTG